MSKARLFGRDDLGPQVCAQCKKPKVLGFMLAVKVHGERFRVCSFECEKALKESRKVA